MGGIVYIGAGDGIRTRDINLGKVALYQLSYSRSLVLLYCRSTGPRCQLKQSSCLNHDPCNFLFQSCMYIAS